MPGSTSNAQPAEANSPALTLPDLPSELIDHILSYLSPIDLTSVSLVNKTLCAHAVQDHLWQAIVQSHVPGVRLTTSYPCASFRELYAAHDPRWFLTKYKIWFCDRDLTGKLVIVRYDERRGVIEGYQLLATSTQSSSEISSPSLMDTDLEIHDFDPHVQLHLDRPVLEMRANSLENIIRATTRKSSATSIKGLSGLAQWGSSFATASTAPSAPSTTANFSKFSAEIPMPLGDKSNDAMFSNFMLARALPPAQAEERSLRSFPYGNVWPPPAIPASERVSAAHFSRDGPESLPPEDRPAKRSEISDKSFRIRSWMEMRPAGLRGMSMGWGAPSSHDGDWSFDSSSSVFAQASRPWLPTFLSGPHSSVSAHIGDSVTTFSTLDPEVYTPTADQPWKGIWVGDYSTHGCEFLLIKQSHPTPFDEAAFAATRTDAETDAEFAQRRANARKYRGRLEAVKLTGDVNVPRGECSFVADDIGDRGYVTTVEEQPFLGARVVHSKGHIARSGFTHGKL